MLLEIFDRSNQQPSRRKINIRSMFPNNSAARMDALESIQKVWQIQTDPAMKQRWSVTFADWGRRIIDQCAVSPGHAKPDNGNRPERNPLRDFRPPIPEMRGA